MDHILNLFIYLPFFFYDVKRKSWLLLSSAVYVTTWGVSVVP